MGLFRRDPERKAIAERARWLEGLPIEARGLGQSVLVELPSGWTVSRVDRETFRGGVTTYGVTAVSPAGALQGAVAETPSEALQAMLARLRGQLQPTPIWVPPSAAGGPARDHRSLADLERAGWTVQCDGERYGVPGVAVTGAVARRGEDESTAIAAIVSGGRDRRDEARAALDRLLRGELEPTPRWAPA